MKKIDKLLLYHVSLWHFIKHLWRFIDGSDFNGVITLDNGREKLPDNLVDSMDMLEKKYSLYFVEYSFVENTLKRHLQLNSFLIFIFIIYFTWNCLLKF